MPTVDMSLEKLRSYQGINPRPADFDEYWDRALAEMNAIDPAPVFTPADIPSAIADCYHLNFRSTKGANIYARFVKPKNISGKVPAVLMFHGLSGSCDSFSKMLNYASQGYVVAFLDSRGQGKSSAVESTYGSSTVPSNCSDVYHSVLTLPNHGNGA